MALWTHTSRSIRQKSRGSLHYGHFFSTESTSLDTDIYSRMRMTADFTRRLCVGRAFALLPSDIPAGNQDQACTICLEDFDENTKTTPCGHTFHLECLKHLLIWMPGIPQCPNCRRDIFSAEWQVANADKVNLSGLEYQLYNRPPPATRWIPRLIERNQIDRFWHVAQWVLLPSESAERLIAAVDQLLQRLCNNPCSWRMLSLRRHQLNLNEDLQKFRGYILTHPRLTLDQRALVEQWLGAGVRDTWYGASLAEADGGCNSDCSCRSNVRLSDQFASNIMGFLRREPEPQRIPLLTYAVHILMYPGDRTMHL